MIHPKSLRQMRWSREHAAALVAVLALLALLAPLPGFVLDLLLTVSLAFGLAVLLVAMLSEGPLGFPAMPGVLVAGSLARVALALAVARSLLAHGTAGTLVQTLGNLVTAAGENLAGGVIALGLLLLAAYVVLNLGLMRLAEVAARFALDALPGRQMALDAALAGGRLEREAGAAETARLHSENAFYGAMDGAARF
ncbi:MAG: FHIPEP family type III secretion protein, partial [Armatimonadetes bacterium]|nr:FHIPEP family type III secretion protein [Armatimonadota bacterium]